MKHDQDAIRKLILESDGKVETIVKKIDAYVEKIRIEAFGWTLAEACVLADNGTDIRTLVVDKMADRMNVDFANFEQRMKVLVPEEDSTHVITPSTWVGFKS